MGHNYDIVVIGSGMGGLVCADILGREGYKVCVLEKNRQLGGCLQTFSRKKVIFDSGVHYIGGLCKGQNLYQVFKYLGLMDKLKLERIDVEAFDKIIIENDDKEYVFAQGYDRFIAGLLKNFPQEEEGINKYCNMIREVCIRFPLYNLRSGGSYTEKESVLDMDAEAFIASCTTNKKLQAVLGGNNILYAGQGGKTPFYVHALILNHYIESSWKCIDGGSQISKLLAANIRKAGGEIIRNAEVVSIKVENDKASHVVLKDGSEIYGHHFISNLHPAQTIAMTDSPALKPAFRNRIKSLENTISSFTLNLIFKKDSFRYFSNNYYYHREGKLWEMDKYTEENWPLGYALFLSAGRGNQVFAESASIIAYMRFEEMAPWADTFNTSSFPDNRGEDYEAFKKRKTEILLNCVEEKFPGFKECIDSSYVATPLSYRDYIGTTDGSMYGVAKNVNDVLKTFISARTRIPNLFLTGQNLNLHGILGATMSGLVTSITLIGNESVVEKIRNA